MHYLNSPFPRPWCFLVLAFGSALTMGAAESGKPSADWETPAHSYSAPGALAPQAAASPPAPIVITQDLSPLVESNAQISARLTTLERFFVAQGDREATAYRDTNRLITVFGISFAAMGLSSLMAAAFLNYRTIRLMQPVPQAPTQMAAAGASTIMPAAGAAVPGMERVHAHGQRFEAKISSLEARLSEMEQLSGLRPASRDAGSSVEPATSSASLVEEIFPEEPMAPKPREKVIPMPMAAILARKAETLMSLGKNDQALAVLDHALKMGAEGSDVHLVRGRLFEKLGRLADALSQFDSATKADPKCTTALLLKAGVLDRQEKFDEALACYERALELNRQGC